MSKQSFLDCKKPLLTAMIQKPDPDSCISAIRNAVYDGAEAFGFQICELKREYRDEETFRHIFSYCGSHPIYITNYRQRYSDKVSDEDRTEEKGTLDRRPHLPGPDGEGRTFFLAEALLSRRYPDLRRPQRKTDVTTPDNSSVPSLAGGKRRPPVWAALKVLL